MLWIVSVWPSFGVRMGIAFDIFTYFWCLIEYELNFPFMFNPLYLYMLANTFRGRRMLELLRFSYSICYTLILLLCCRFVTGEKKSSLVTQSPINPKYFSNKREPFVVADNIFFKKKKKEKSVFKSSLQTSWRPSNFGCPFDKLNTRTCIDSICDKH